MCHTCSRSFVPLVTHFFKKTLTPSFLFFLFLFLRLSTPQWRSTTTMTNHHDDQPRRSTPAFTTYAWQPPPWQLLYNDAHHQDHKNTMHETMHVINQTLPLCNTGTKFPFQLCNLLPQREVGSLVTLAIALGNFSRAGHATTLPRQRDHVFRPHSGLWVIEFLLHSMWPL